MSRIFLFGAFLITLVLLPASPVHATCVLTDAAWGSGSISVGQPVEVTVLGSGCQGFEVAINVYKDAPIDFHIKTASIRFQTSTQATGTISISNEEFMKVYDSRSTIPIYFKANAGGSGVRSGGTINLTGTPPGTTPVPPAPAKTSPGASLSFDLNLNNPLGGANDLMELIKKISQWIFNLAIPVGVIMIIVGGLEFLFAGANPAMAQRGKDTLKYAVIGLAIVFIGYGFVALVQSIIKLGDKTTTQSPSPTVRTP